jgi:hypothetical protein
MNKRILIIKQYIISWIEWQDAKEWAKAFHPSWLQLATQRKRPEIRKTYKNKILDAYRKGY